MKTVAQLSLDQTGLDVFFRKNTPPFLPFIGRILDPPEKNQNVSNFPA